MKTANKIVNIIDKILSYATYIFLVLIMALGIYALYDNYAVGSSGKLDDEIVSLSPDVVGDELFSIESLKEINEDIVGWIRIYDTKIDYPVVIGEDNSEYLNINYKGEYATAGSIFLDYRNNSDFKDDYSVIYGHNMSAGYMFSDIKKYSNKEFFNNHLKGRLYTNDGIYEIDVYVYSYVNAFSNEAYNIHRVGNNSNAFLLDYFKNKATNINNIEISSNDKLLLLSTCDSTGSSDRNVVLAKLTKITNSDGEVIINENGERILTRIDEENNPTTTPITTRKVEVKTVKKHISIRTILIIIGIIIVAIIFIILFIRVNSKNKENK